MIADSLSNNVSPSIDIESIVDVKVIQLEIDENLLDDNIEELYRTYLINLRKYNDEIHEYIEKKAIWLANYSKYSQRLEVLINTTKIRREIIEYIKLFSLGDIVSDIIKILESDDYIPVPSGIEVSISREKADKTDIIYWLVEYKDYITAELVKVRPIKPIKACKCTLYTLLSRLSLLRLRFIKNSIKYYLIEISIKSSTIIDKKEIMFKLNGSDSWISRKRANCDSGPFSF